MDERTYLKVKIKSLAEEARIIRLETKRARKISIKNGLALHRTGIVRLEARHTQLAYGFLRGLAYSQMESKTHKEPDWKKIKRMIEKYGSHWDRTSPTCYSSIELQNVTDYREANLARLDVWIKEATVYVKLQKETTEVI